MTTFSVLMNGSAAADNALAYALMLVRYLRRHQQPVELRLLAVLPARHDAAAAYFPRPTGQSADALVAGLCAQAAELAAQGPCRFTLVTRNVAAELTQLFHFAAADVLVVGRPADTALPTARSLFYLCRLLPNPLLLVPAAFAAPAEVPARLALDTDGQAVRLPSSARRVTELLLSLRQDTRVLYLGSGRRAAGRLLAQLAPSTVGIHVYTADEPAPPPAALLARLAEIGLLGDLPHTLHTAYHSSVEEGILQLIQACEAELLLLVARQRTLPGEQFETSTSARLMLRSPIPALVVPEAAPVRWRRRC
ncbi:hypothetical protein LJ737_26265 [Hymenobacter sp. 15J16-1T3B]|uniref:universal stress protein n=1 Tax=Hymenobacter sp. 15J16-1T3B TaxID=2886941 RepID=UPI001D0F5780|nr:universal stress protein [Hymenobacter sp. 15J16-1T3B]MCC3160769.1 hypothetical protein [Hymenobacter sp. 15J16-1T3B]